MSSVIAEAGPPAAAAARAAASASRSATTTRQPSATRRRATARPIRPPPPVINAVSILVQPDAAGEVEADAGDVARARRQQERDRIADIGRCAEAPERRLPPAASVLLLFRGLHGDHLV